jgi:glycosyltransferase involved in cell wall biosynthesis
VIHASVIVPVFRDEAGIKTCLQSLEKQNFPRDEWELIVVDNSPIASTSLRYLVLNARAKYLHEPKPGSYAARNAGIELAEGKILAFTDSDCLPSENWLAEGIKMLNACSGICVVGGRVNMRLSSKARLIEMYDFTYRFPQSEVIERHSVATTANLFVEKTTFDRIGRFDANLFSGGDYEWCTRLKAFGIPIFYCDGAAVDHPCETSLAKIVRRVRRIAGGKLISTDTMSERLKRGPKSATVLKLPLLTSLQLLLLRVFLLSIKRIEQIRLLLGGTRERA